ncbi:MAG: tetratricopeptide repeat protein [Planctomycetota bacterium]|nr:tetratricopeptide repeat protein [Planctomycetota bacterium]
MSRRLLLLLLPPLLALLVSPARAQDEDLPPDDVQDLVERYVARGDDSLRQGNYVEAILRFRKALRRDPKHRGARFGVVACLKTRGKYDEANEELDLHFKLHPGDREALVLKAEIDLARGRDASAREGARKVIAGGGEGPDRAGRRARLVLAEALARTGKRDEARNVLDYFLQYYEDRFAALTGAADDAAVLRGDPTRGRPISAELTEVAQALRMYVDLSPLDYEFIQNALDLVVAARDIDPQNWDALVEYVRITRADRRQANARARKALTKAEKQNPEIADLYVEAARTLLNGWNDAEARSLAETALVINPNHTDAHAIVARVMLEDFEYGDAQEHIHNGLKTDPRHRALLSLQATLDLLVGDDEGFEKGMKRVLAIDPTYGEGFHIAGLVVAGRQRRFDRAAELTRRGLEIDPLNHEAYASMGVFLANLGRSEEALKMLKHAKKAFPWEHPIRDNFASVLEDITLQMTKKRTEHFIVRLDATESELYGPFLIPLLEECWDDMVQRYGFTPRAPILVEVFQKADDFSVRTLGLPGIPAIGACFGGLITLDSPKALKPGAFLWAATARHEFAHVMSLQLSGGQVPRWFTEGLSVLEEKPLDSGWGLDMQLERELYDAYHAGDVPKIAKFDAMFRTNRVGFAYHVGGHMLEMLRQRSGEKGIVKALRLWGKDTPMREVFKEAFDLELEEFDRLFLEYVGARVSKWKLRPRYGRHMEAVQLDALNEVSNGEKLLKLAWAHYDRREVIDAGAWLDRASKQLPEDHTGVLLMRYRLELAGGRQDRAKSRLDQFFAAGGEEHQARLDQAQFLGRDGKEAEAIEAYKKAKEDWPLTVGPSSPYHHLYQYYAKEGEPRKALAQLEEHAGIASRSIELKLKLARNYRLMKGRPEAIEVLEKALQISVYDARIHQALLPLYRAEGNTKKVIRSARFLVKLLPDDVGDEVALELWLDLAAALLEDGQQEEARAALREAQELDGEAPRLQELKKKLQEEE